jgi:hypothetical protein
MQQALRAQNWGWRDGLPIYADLIGPTTISRWRSLPS